MPGNSHPADLAIVDGVDVSKASVRSYEKVRNRLRVASAAEIRATDLTLQTAGLDLNGAFYELDTSDTTTADDGLVCIIDAAGNRFINENQFSHIEFVFDGDGSTLSSSSVPDGFLDVHGDCNIVRWRLFGDAAGSAVVDIWKVPFATYAASGMSVANSITAAAKPTLSSDRAEESTTLTGWTTEIDNGDVLGFKIDSVSAFTKLTLSLRVRHRIR